MRYKITQTINDQFLAEFTFLQSFGYQDDMEWFVDKITLDQIDNSGDAIKSVNQACLDLYAQTQDDFFIVDNFYQFYQLQKQKNISGFDVYEKIVGDLSMNGGIPGSLDDSFAVYGSLTMVRMMLKDGMFETALRYWVTDIKPTSPFTTEQNDAYQMHIENLCIQYGTAQAIVDVIKTAPKGTL